MDEEIQECFAPENGFMSKVCEYAVPLDTVPSNASLLAASASTGMLVIAQAMQSTYSLLVMKNFAHSVPSGIRPGSSQLADVDTVCVNLPSACFWIGWSPDDSMLAATCMGGDILVYGAQHLAMGTTQPLSHMQFPNLRQLAWAGNSQQLYMIDKSYELSHLSLAHASAPRQLQAGVTAVATSSSLVAVADRCDLCIHQQTHDGLQLLLKHAIEIPVDEGETIIDGMVFISDDTLILEVC